MQAFVGEGPVLQAYVHPCFKNITQEWPMWLTRELQIDALNNILQEFHGRVQEYDFAWITFEFDTEADLTAFVLTWG
jgi:hypothetical protein